MEGINVRVTTVWFGQGEIESDPGNVIGEENVTLEGLTLSKFFFFHSVMRVGIL